MLSLPNAHNILQPALLDRVVRCCEGAGQTRATKISCNKNLTIFKLDPTSCNMLLQGGQTRVLNALRSTMLQDVALKSLCCMRLAGPL